MGDLSEDFDKKKGHNKRHAGRKAEKKTAKNKHVQELTSQQRNPKASAFQSAVKAQRKFARYKVCVCVCVCMCVCRE